jgi:hypothetical protein
MPLDLFSHPVGEDHGSVQHGPRQQQHEFFAAVPAGTIDLAHFLAEDLREIAKHDIAGLVAIGVVHALEAVEIAHHARKRLVQPFRMLEHLAQALLEVPSIVEPCEGVCL